MTIEEPRLVSAPLLIQWTMLITTIGQYLIHMLSLKWCLLTEHLFPWPWVWSVAFCYIYKCVCKANFSILYV